MSGVSSDFKPSPNNSGTHGSKTPIACGVDLGGTKIAVALGALDGSLLVRDEIRDHRSMTEDGIVERIASCVRDLVSRHGSHITDLAGVAVGTAGHVDFGRGVLISNSNLPGFVDYPIAAKMSDALGVPVAVDNDTNAQAYAEYLYGAGRGFTNVVFVTVSTGLGAGIVVDGRIFRGATGTAGEIGHTIVNPASRIKCGCGNYGCLMAHASGLSLPQVVREKAASVETTVDLAEIPDEEITGEFVRTMFEQGDRLFTDVVFEHAEYFGLGLHNLVQTLSPGLIIVGGGLTGWGEQYLEHARNEYLKLVTVCISNPPEIRLSKLGADAAVIGAAALAFEAGGIKLGGAGHQKDTT